MGIIRINIYWFVSTPSHLYLKEQEYNTDIPYSIHKNSTKQPCYKKRLSTLFRESFYLL